MTSELNKAPSKFKWPWKREEVSSQGSHQNQPSKHPNVNDPTAAPPIRCACTVVIINGEIVQDSDPRARAARGQQPAVSPRQDQATQRGFGARVARVGEGGDFAGGQQGGGSGSGGRGWGGGATRAGAAAAPRGGGSAGGGVGAVGDGPLVAVAKMLGIEVGALGLLPSEAS